MTIDRKYWQDAIDEVFAPVARQPQQQVNNLAQYLLLHTASDKAITNLAGAPLERPGAKSEHHGLLGKIFDAVSAPLYTTQTFLHDTLDSFKDEIQQGSNPLEAVVNTAKEAPEKGIKNIGANLIRGEASGLGAIADMTGLSHIPGIGDKLVSAEEKGWDVANKLAPRHLTSDTLHDVYGVDNKAALMLGGFAGDVLTDPLTYVPGVDIFTVGKKAKLLEQGLREGDNLSEELIAEAAAKSSNDGRNLVRPATEITPTPVADLATAGLVRNAPPKLDLPGQIIPNRVLENFGESVLRSPEDVAAMKAAKRSDDAKRAANVRWGKPVDWHDIPNEMTQTERAVFTDQMRAGKMAKKGIVADGKGNISMQAGNDVLRDIANGTMPRFGPKVSPVDDPTLIASVNSVLSDSLKNVDRTAGEFKPAVQVDIYNQLRKDAAKALGKGRTAEQVDELSLRMLKTAEDSLISNGIHPTFFNGMRVRLSDVLAETGVLPVGKNNIDSILHAFATGDTKVIKNPQLAEAINATLARRSLSMADLLAKLTAKTDDLKSAVTSDLLGNPVAQKRLAVQAKEAATSVGATVSESNAIRDYILQHVGLDNTPVDEVMSRLTPKLMTEIAEGPASKEAAAKINTAILNTIQKTPEQLSKDITGNAFIDSFFTRFSATAGKGRYVKNVKDDYFAAAELYSGARARWLINIRNTHTPDQIRHAFYLAQRAEIQNGKFFAGHESDEAVKKLAGQFHDLMTSLLGGTGMEKVMSVNGTDAIRSRMLMNEVNDMLKAMKVKNFKFTDSKRVAMHFAGSKDVIVRDYSAKGYGWMSSWETADAFGKDPLKFIQDIDVAMSKVAARNLTLDELALAFGAKPNMTHFKPDIHTKSVAIDRLSEYRFHPEIADKISRLYHEMLQGPWIPDNKMMKFIIGATRKWKTSVTIYRPLHHERNVIGDSFNMWIAGINDPMVFKKSMQILSSQKSRYTDALRSADFEHFKELLTPEALGNIERGAVTQDGNVVGKVITNVRGFKLTAEQYYAAAYHRNLLKDYNVIEDLNAGRSPLQGMTAEHEAKGWSVTRPFGGKVHQGASKVSEVREHFVRMAHFNGAVEKGLRKLGHHPTESEMNRIFDEAAARVSMYHPDGSGLTQFEQKVRVVIPFYSWTRREIPLLIQAMFERPAKITAYPKLQYNMQTGAGFQQNDDKFLDPFPDDQLFPDWLRATGIGPIGDPQSDNPFAAFFGKLGNANVDESGQREGDVIVNPGNPFNDIVSSLFGLEGGNPLKTGLLNNMTPALQIPINLGTDQTFSGAPISKANGGKGLADYLQSQTPFLQDFNRLSGRQDKEGTDNGVISQNILNFLLGIGIKGTGPYEKQAEFEAKERARNASQ